MRIYRVLLSTAFVGVMTAQSTGTLSGTINGPPLPGTVLNVPRQSAVNAFVLAHQRKPASDADEKEVDTKWHQIQCDRLKGALMRAAREVVKQQLGVVVTEHDLEAAKKIVQLRDPVGQAAALRNRAAAILEAISAVYDQHQDPAQVYDRILAKQQIPKELWTVQLNQSSTPAGRQALEKKLHGQLTITNEAVMKAVSSLELWRGPAERMKLDDAVDQDIAAHDPTFRTYLAEYKTFSEERHTKHAGLPLDHKQYLDNKRASFWNLQTAQLNVHLSDASIQTACGSGTAIR